MPDLMDPAEPPSPHGGWSCTVRSVDNAVVAHVQQGHLRRPSGVFDAIGDYVLEAVHWRGRHLMVPPPFPDEVDHLPGRWLWGGVLMDHFGHFLTESTGRLWALDALDRQPDGIVFLPESGFGGTEELELKGHQSQFLRLLGVRLPVRILRRAARIDRLEVPGPGFGIGPLISGTAPFRQFIHRRFAREVAPNGNAKVYVSRSRLDPQLGGIIGETRLEQWLAEAGYAIYHPQDHDLADQVATYKAAGRIVALDGSALHLVALVARPDQQVAVIKRRKGPAPNGIVEHLSAFSGRQPQVIDAIRRNWIRSDRGKIDNFSYGELDFQALGHQLARTGFLPANPAWDNPGRQQIEDSITQLEKHLWRDGLTFRPDRPVEADGPGSGPVA